MTSRGPTCFSPIWGGDLIDPGKRSCRLKRLWGDGKSPTRSLVVMATASAVISSGHRPTFAQQGQRSGPQPSGFCEGAGEGAEISNLRSPQCF
jgi:hypothetical protein